MAVLTSGSAVRRPSVHRDARAIRATVAVCTRDRARYLGGCLSTLVNQFCDGDEIEVLVVDNGSSDDTPALLDIWRRSGPRRRVIVEPNVGLSHARNTALRASDREVVIFTDDDALVPPTWARAHLSAYRTEFPPGAAGGPVGLVWPSGRPTWVGDELTPWYSGLDLGDVDGQFPGEHGPYGTNMSVWREAALAVGGFDTRFGRTGRRLLSSEERVMSHRLSAAGWQLRYVPAAAVVQQVLPERLSPRWVVRRGWAQGISNGRFEATSENLSACSQLRRAGEELRESMRLGRNRRRDDGELADIAVALAHAGTAVELARSALVATVHR